MITFIQQHPYQAPICEWMRLNYAELLCVSPGGIEDIDEEEWING